MNLNKYLKGLSLTIVIGIISFFLSHYILIGSVTIAIIIGAIITNTLKLNKTYDEGISYAEKTLLGYAIALMGVNLNFAILSSLGVKTLFLIVLSIVVTIYSAVIIGRYFKLDSKFSLLLGIGNGICGASAISATAPILKADKNHIGISIAIVNLLGTIGIFLVPAITLVFKFDDIQSGVLVGNTLQAIGQVTAGGFSINETVGISATAVKMGRVLLLTPLIFILIYFFHIKNSDEGAKKVKIPRFIIVFGILSLISSFGFIEEEIKTIISNISHSLLIVAMAAIGLKINFSSIKEQGKKAFQIASLVFFIQILFSLIFLSFS